MDAEGRGVNAGQRMQGRTGQGPKAEAGAQLARPLPSAAPRLAMHPRPTWLPLFCQATVGGAPALPLSLYAMKRVCSHVVDCSSSSGYGLPAGGAPASTYVMLLMLAAAAP